MLVIAGLSQDIIAQPLQNLLMSPFEGAPDVAIMGQNLNVAEQRCIWS